MTYCVDTSAWIAMWNDLYPPDVFGRLWQKIDSLVGAGRLLASEAVRDELQMKDDALYRWVKGRTGLFVPTSELQREGEQIQNEFPSLVKSRAMMRGWADAFVIALAEQRRLIVVTTEKSSPKHPRIPDVCKARSVPCVGPVEMFRKEGWHDL